VRRPLGIAPFGNAGQCGDRDLRRLSTPSSAGKLVNVLLPKAPQAGSWAIVTAPFFDFSSQAEHLEAFCI